MDQIIKSESNYNVFAKNSTSGACGLGQANPCEKLTSICPDLGDISCQMDWMIRYIKNRYQTPKNALDFHLANGWY